MITLRGKFSLVAVVRDDGERLDLTGSEVRLSADNSLLQRPDIDTSDIDYTDTDGGEMIRQRLSTYTQSINGLILPKESGFWKLIQ